MYLGKTIQENYMLKKMMLMMVALCLLLAGCGQSKQDAADAEVPEQPAVETEAEQESSGNTEEAAAVTVQPLPDTTMENLTDAILSVSLEEGDAYVDDTGKMQMDLKIYVPY